MTLIELIIDLAHETLVEREGYYSQAQARLALALDQYGHGYEIAGRESCNCGDRENCDECPERLAVIASLTKLAGPHRKEDAALA
jgi:hypothetical protein